MAKCKIDLYPRVGYTVGAIAMDALFEVQEQKTWLAIRDTKSL